MKARIYQFLILFLQFECGTWVEKKEWDFNTEVIFIVLPFSILSAIFFKLYENELYEDEIE